MPAAPSEAFIETHSPTWRRVRSEAEDQIEAARALLEGTGCDPRLADHIRGQLHAYRTILALAPGKESG